MTSSASRVSVRSRMVARLSWKPSSAGHAERDLLPVLEVEVERDERVPLVLHGALDAADLAGVQEELARAALGVRTRAQRK